MSIRLTYIIGLTAIVVLLLISIYLQYFENIIPCPLCSMQRLTFGLLGFLFLTGLFVHARFWGRLVVNSLCVFFSGFGIVLAGRQIWLQNFPSTVGNECGVSLEYMIGVLPINEILQKIFHGTVECSQRTWEFLYLDMAEWSVIWFSFFLLLSLYLLLKEFRWTQRNPIKNK